MGTVRVYRINKSRFYPIMTIIALFFIFALLLVINLVSSTAQYEVKDFMSDQLLMYFEAGEQQGVPWYYLAAIDKVEDIPKEEISKGRSAAIALHLIGIERDNELPLFLKSYRTDKKFAKKVVKEVRHFKDMQQIYQHKTFPIPEGYEYTYEDGYGDARSYGGERRHEGTDLMAEMDIPVVSVGSGVVEQVGWNELGGWRLGIRGDDRVYYYYAHLARYQGKPKKGDKIKKGQIIGYVGDSGYGKEGTTGEFAPHLHFGMYVGRGKGLKAFNPYPFLRAWER